MARLADQACRLTPEAYPQVFAMRAAYGDVDSYRHLNNVALVGYFEEGRATMNMGLFGVETIVRPEGGVQLLFASVTVDYLAVGEYPGELVVATAISHIGRSSFSQAGALFQGGRCLALCEAVTVYSIDGVAQPLPADARTEMEALLLRG